MTNPTKGAGTESQDSRSVCEPWTQRTKTKLALKIAATEGNANIARRHFKVNVPVTNRWIETGKWESSVEVLCFLQPSGRLQRFCLK